MRHWSRNDKFAFFGVILAVISVASGVFGHEIRQSLGLDAPQNQASIAAPAVPSPDALQGPVLVKSALTGSSVTIHVTGDSNMISIRSSDLPSGSQSYSVGSDIGTSEFQLGPKQTARVELLGDSNTVHIPGKLEDRVTVVDSGDRNTITH